MADLDSRRKLLAWRVQRALDSVGCTVWFDPLKERVEVIPLEPSEIMRVREASEGDATNPSEQKERYAQRSLFS